MQLLIKNAKIITPYQVLEKHSLIIENDKIKDIIKDKACCESEFSDILDLNGKYLSPGFIDIHNHGNSGHDAMESTFEALDTMAGFHIKNGVIGFLATTMTASGEETEKAIKNAVNYMKRKNPLKSQVLGLYLEGPYFSREKKGAQPAQYIKDPDIAELEGFINTAENNIKVVSLAPELTGASNAISFLKSYNITVSAGHTNSSYEEADKAIQRGVSQATHLYNGMRSFSHREPGIIGAVLTDERVRCEMICDGIHIHPSAMKLAVKMKGVEGVILISDAMMAAGLEDGEYFLGGQKVFVKGGAARLADGTLAGSTLTLDRAVYNMIHLAGIPLKDAVRMASLNPARAIGADDRKGSIEIGKDAHLIVFDDGIHISEVIMHGHTILIDRGR